MRLARVTQCFQSVHWEAASFHVSPYSSPSFPSSLGLCGGRWGVQHEDMEALRSFAVRHSVSPEMEKQLREQLYLRLLQKKSETESFLNNVPRHLRVAIMRQLHLPLVQGLQDFQGCSTSFLNQLVSRCHRGTAIERVTSTGLHRVTLRFRTSRGCSTSPGVLAVCVNQVGGLSLVPPRAGGRMRERGRHPERSGHHGRGRRNAPLHCGLRETGAPCGCQSAHPPLCGRLQ